MVILQPFVAILATAWTTLPSHALKACIGHCGGCSQVLLCRVISGPFDHTWLSYRLLSKLEGLETMGPYFPLLVCNYYGGP